MMKINLKRTRNTHVNIFLALFLSSFLISLLTSCSTVSKINDSNRKSGLPFGINTKEVKVYFTKSKNPEALSFVPVTRRISLEDNPIDASLKELFLGPTKKEELKGIMTEIPIGTRLIKIEESEDEILIDVSGQYLTGGGSATMQLRYLQLYKTLNNIAPDKKVYLQIDGKNIKAIGGEGLEVTQPLTKINDYTQKYEKTDKLDP